MSKTVRIPDMFLKASAASKRKSASNTENIPEKVPAGNENQEVKKMKLQAPEPTEILLKSLLTDRPSVSAECSQVVGMQMLLEMQHGARKFRSKPD
ncbi:Uracil-DNA glycosylase [Caenorhabditis elegans]|uniref:Isoform b of Uracil-DNA glycosylase n=2 Tax=Caenorhabditis elegans TaxID=6239 RepID=Q9U221-2|nr:Uracil-DNA glycosylase [Caenorhabditis elegans]CAC42381.1 Uracil-DNA glycosylase [Caenorhabditis elegans]|eukprot:NP_499561.1 Uracil-DNA glycosylase [Caenorhabditis elegans]